MEIQNLFDLPAHPLLVHIPVVLIPLTAIGAVMIALSARWRGRIGWIVVAMGVVAAAGTYLAAGSGEALEETVRETSALERHTELAEAMGTIALVLAVAVLGLVLLDRLVLSRRSVGAMAARPPWGRPVGIAVATVVVVASLVATVWVVRVGHSGAKSVWERTGVTQVQP